MTRLFLVTMASSRVDLVESAARKLMVALTGDAKYNSPVFQPRRKLVKAMEAACGKRKREDPPYLYAVMVEEHTDCHKRPETDAHIEKVYHTEEEAYAYATRQQLQEYWGRQMERDEGDRDEDAADMWNIDASTWREAFDQLPDRPTGEFTSMEDGTYYSVSRLHISPTEAMPAVAPTLKRLKADLDAEVE